MIRRVTTGVLAVLMGLSAVLTLLLTAVEVVAFDEGRYERAYVKTQRAEDIGISQSELMGVTRHLLGYLKDKQDNLEVRATIGGTERQVFNSKELLHMQDVKQLFHIGFVIRNLALIAFLLTGIALWLLERRWTKAFPGGYLAAFGIMLALLIAFGIAAVMDFNGLFIKFHELVFTNDLWLLDPATDVLIQMFPEVFFNDMAMAMVKTIGLFLVVPAVLSGINLIWFYRKHKKGVSTP